MMRKSTIKKYVGPLLPKTVSSPFPPQRAMAVTSQTPLHGPTRRSCTSGTSDGTLSPSHGLNVSRTCGVGHRIFGWSSLHHQEVWGTMRVKLRGGKRDSKQWWAVAKVKVMDEDEALMPHNVPTKEINSDMVRRLRERKNKNKNGCWKRRSHRWSLIEKLPLIIAFLISLFTPWKNNEIKNEHQNGVNNGNFERP